MARRRVQFTYDASQIREPIIYELGRQFEVITNIRRADVIEDRGWVILELEGEEDRIDQGLAWVESRGVRVDPVVWDVVEG
jgi:hypothetical protein